MSAYIEQMLKGDKIKITNVKAINQGEYLWNNNDIVEIKDVEIEDDRIEVWNADRSLSEYIYISEFHGIKLV